MQQRLQFAGAAHGARNRVVDGRHLAAHRLTHRGDRLLGQPVRLGEPHRHLGHRRGHQLELLGAPDQQRQEPEQRDWNDDRGDGGEPGRVGDELAHRRYAGELAAEEGVGNAAAHQQPDQAGTERDVEHRARGALLQRVDQPSDRGEIVIRGDRLPRASTPPAGGFVALFRRVQCWPGSGLCRGGLFRLLLIRLFGFGRGKRLCRSAPLRLFTGHY